MNNLKKIMALAVLLATSIFYAQDRPDHDKIKVLKVAFITERLNLSSKEAETFWPIYNEYEEQRAVLRHKQWTQVRDKIKVADDLGEKEAANLLKQHLKFEEEEEELDKNFLEKVAKVISAKKTLLLIRSEEEFKRQLIRQYRHKKGEE